MDGKITSSQGIFDDKNYRNIKGARGVPLAYWFERFFLPSRLLAIRELTGDGTVPGVPTGCIVYSCMRRPCLKVLTSLNCPPPQS